MAIISTAQRSISVSYLDISRSALGALVDETPGLAGATLFLLALTLWMIVEIVIIRFNSIAEAKRIDALTRIWEPVFFAAAVSDSETVLPRLRRADHARVLAIWCRVGDYVIGDAQQRLNAVARKLRLDKVALDILRKRWLVIRESTQVELLLAIRAAERLHLEPAWLRLSRLVKIGPAPLDRYAARALVALDAARAAQAVLPALIRQGRWARHLVEDLVEAGAGTAIETYAGLLASVADDAVPGLALLLDRCNDQRAVAAVRARLRADSTRDPEAVAALLNTLSVVGARSDRQLVLDYVDHAQWFVRMRAAQALGRCGYERDADILATLLGDRNWYTRYHAARAILRLPDLGATHLAALGRTSPDRYARDIAHHALAETAAPAVR